nr:MAG TPA: hypothetical protein [Caudoviricetes sp.]
MTLRFWCVTIVLTKGQKMISSAQNTQPTTET